MEPLISVDKLEELLSGQGVTQVQVDGVSAAIRNYCGWHVTPVVNETLTVDGNGGTILDLPTLHLVSVSEVRVRGAAVPDVEWSSDGTLRGSWPDRYRGVEVTISHGYATAPDLITVAMDAMARAAQSELGGGEETIGPFSFGASQGGVSFFAHELAVLDRYRLPRLP
ncbi:hypothetical protein [Rhodococcus sp. BE178]|uniref:hypothetical protein n=1 Tax=Rhodococcus sp. BE178 TaxID=2817737 RepID=UPI003D1AABEA